VRSAKADFDLYRKLRMITPVQGALKHSIGTHLASGAVEIPVQETASPLIHALLLSTVRVRIGFTL